MKTPRELLFERHRASEAKLDSLRREVLSVVAKDRHSASRKTKGFNPAEIPSLLWRELVLPCRRVWMGLAAVWLVILALNFAARDTSPTLAKSSPPPSPEMLAAVQNQKRLLAEMLQDQTKTSDADRPKPSPLSPQSELTLPVITT